MTPRGLTIWPQSPFPVSLPLPAAASHSPSHRCINVPQPFNRPLSRLLSSVPSSWAENSYSSFKAQFQCHHPGRLSNFPWAPPKLALKTTVGPECLALWFVIYPSISCTKVPPGRLSQLQAPLRDELLLMCTTSQGLEREIPILLLICIFISAFFSVVKSLSSVAYLCLTLQPHGPQHARLPCPSPTPRACSNSCPWSRWCHPTISSSVGPFSSPLQSFPASGSLPMSQLFTSGGQSIRASASGSVLPKNIQNWFPLELTSFISLLSTRLKSLLQHHSSKASILQCSAFFMVQLSHPYMTTGKTTALTRQTFVGNVSAF